MSQWGKEEDRMSQLLPSVEPKGGDKMWMQITRAQSKQWPHQCFGSSPLSIPSYLTILLLSNFSLPRNHGAQHWARAVWCSKSPMWTVSWNAWLQHRQCASAHLCWATWRAWPPCSPSNSRPCLRLHQLESQKCSDTSPCTPTPPWPTPPGWQSSPAQPPTFPASVLSSLAASSPCFSPLEPRGTIHSSRPCLQPSLLSGSCLSTLLPGDIWWFPKVSSNALLSAPQTFSSPIPTIPLLVFESLSLASQGQDLRYLCICIPSI